MNRIILTGRNRDLPRNAFSAAMNGNAHVTLIHMGGRSHQIPSQEYLSETTFRHEAGICGRQFLPLSLKPKTRVRSVPPRSYPSHAGHFGVLCAMFVCSVMLVAALTVVML